VKPNLSTLFLTALILAATSGCSDEQAQSDSDSETSDSTIVSGVTENNEPDTQENSNASESEQVNDNIESVWILNPTELRSGHIMETSSSNGVIVNVQTVQDESLSGAIYTKVTAQGIPKYDVSVDQTLYNELVNRPKANSDFVIGLPTVNLGDVVSFGQDIGYASNANCEDNAGYGYWPPGPDCPTQMDKSGYFTQSPEPTEEDCDTGLGVIGYWVNGTSVYNWGDGQSYNNNNVWFNLAPVAEQYDVDICGGHAAQGDYHHHFYSSCLADLVSDNGSAHSPIYGFAADGYPIYGPWQEVGVLAKSSWVTRDYSADSPTGCADNQRSCTLRDAYDITQGTQNVTAGPNLGSQVTTLSGNVLSADNGYYHEDYYWSQELTAKGGAYLDQYNGHFDEQRGYHYHVTVSQQDEKLIPAYPYIIGDRFAGKLPDNAVTQCGGQTPGGQPGGPMPPPIFGG